MPEVAVIGGGPAGSIAAACLARRGWRVTLIERHRFPRAKVCGECVSPLGIEVLGRLGLDREVLKHKPAKLARTTLVACDGEQASIALPRAMWAISRDAMDTVLMDAARAAGVRVMQPVRCEAVDGGCVRYRDLRTNIVSELTTDWVIAAEGKGIFGRDRPKATRDLGVKAHFRGVVDDADAISLFSMRGHYCGLAPIENGRWNVAMSVPVAKVRACGGELQAMFEGLLSENEGLARRMRQAQRVSEWLVAPLPRFAVRERWPAKVIPVGNAAAALEPIGGEGMGLAMRSAELAAGMLADAAEGEIAFDAAALRREYRRLWSVRRFVCRAGAMALSIPVLSGAVVSMVKANERLAEWFVGLTGKSEASGDHGLAVDHGVE